MYTRRHGRRYGLGTYAHTPLPLTPSAAPASAELPFPETEFGAAIAEASALVPVFRTAPRGRRSLIADGVGRQRANLLLETGEFVVAPDLLAPDRFDSWSDAEIRWTAQGHYRGIYDAH